jgi:2-polyprenyl-3-methyl-5-hydroxy-6-metoxy-1,4-benzoquinol methylase
MFAHIRRRRNELRRSIDVHSSFEQWEESCVPSYLHPNPLAAYVSWRRLFVAARLANRLIAGPRRVLDFGSSVGELSHILRYAGTYDFIEADDAPAAYLLSQNKQARRIILEDVPHGEYDAIFAIDSLEHNENYGELLAELAKRLSPEGILILSGPTENSLYRMGRRIAGFHGHYHHTTIFDIEREAEKNLTLVAKRTVPFGIPLFRVTVWKPPAADYDDQ